MAKPRGMSMVITLDPEVRKTMEDFCKTIKRLLGSRPMFVEKKSESEPHKPATNHPWRKALAAGKAAKDEKVRKASSTITGRGR